MFDIDERLSQLESKVESENQSVDEDIVIVDKIVEQDENLSQNENDGSKTPQMTQEQANAIVEAVSNPEKSLGLVVGNQIVQKSQTEEVKKRIDQTADKVIDAGLTSIETNAETNLNKSQVQANKSYFDTHKNQLKRGGVKNETSRKQMERIVATSSLWEDIFYYMFSWWVIGINTMKDNINELPLFFKIILWFCVGTLSAIFIPIALAVGILMTICYLVVRLSKVCYSKCKQAYLLRGKANVENKEKKEENERADDVTDNG
ncbi:MAG: hypothetical protein ACI4PF_01060 [Christensenellales bacterium]